MLNGLVRDSGYTKLPALMAEEHLHVHFDFIYLSIEPHKVTFGLVLCHSLCNDKVCLDRCNLIGL